LSRETREVLNFLVGLAINLTTGGASVLNCNPPCFKCHRSFKEIVDKTRNPYVFMVIKNWLSVEEEDVKFCCLDCCRGIDMMDVVEIHPTLSLLNVKKLMYNRVLKKFVFDFKDTSSKRFKKYAIVSGSSVEEVLRQVFDAKLDNEEIEVMELWEGNRVVARDVVYDMRVDNGTDFNFDAPLSMTPALITQVNKHLNSGHYYIETHYRVFERYQPFTVYFNRSTLYDCAFCQGKMYEDKTPILSCSRCGFTDPDYWRKNKTMMVPFWKGNYDYNKIFWKTLKTNNRKHPDTTVNLMLYNTNVAREK
jgi:hypothetical protein